MPTCWPITQYRHSHDGGLRGLCGVPLRPLCARTDGALFSFVDKLISSLSTTLVAMIYAAIGYTSTLPTQEDPYTTGVLVCTIACFLGMPAIGWILNVVAMKFYPLTKERMAEIQGEVARIKAQAQKSA